MVPGIWKKKYPRKNMEPSKDDMVGVIPRSAAMPPAAPKPKFARSRKARLYVTKTTGISRYQRDTASVFFVVDGNRTGRYETLKNLQFFVHSDFIGDKLGR